MTGDRLPAQHSKYVRASVDAIPARFVRSLGEGVAASQREAVAEFDLIGLELDAAQLHHAGAL